VIVANFPAERQENMSETWEVAIPSRMHSFYLYSPKELTIVEHDDKKGRSMNDIFIGLLAEGWEPFGQSSDSFYPMLRRKTTGPKIP
jgi:hypothetical protein